MPTGNKRGVDQPPSPKQGPVKRPRVVDAQPGIQSIDTASNELDRELLQPLIHWYEDVRGATSHQEPPAQSKSPEFRKHATATNATMLFAPLDKKVTSCSDELDKLIKGAKAELEVLETSLQETLLKGDEVGNVDDKLKPARYAFDDGVLQVQRQYKAAFQDWKEKLVSSNPDAPSIAKSMQHALLEPSDIAKKLVQCYYDLSCMRSRLSQICAKTCTGRRGKYNSVQKGYHKVWNTVQDVKKLADKHSKSQEISQLEQELKAFADDAKVKLKNYWEYRNEGRKVDTFDEFEFDFRTGIIE